MNASRQSFVVSALICALLAALFVARYLLAPMPVEAPFEDGMPLAAALTRLTAARPWFAAAVAAMIVVWTLLVVVQLTVKYAPAASRNYLPAQIFLVCAGGMTVSGEALASLAVAWLSALATRQLAFSFHKGYGFTQVFHAGFYLGIIPLLYAPAAVVVPVIAIAALVIYRRSGREMIVCLATGDGAGFIRSELRRCTFEHLSVWEALPLSGLGVAVPLSALTLVGILWALGHKKNVRKTQYRFMQHTLLALLAVAASAPLPSTSATFFLRKNGVGVHDPLLPRSGCRLCFQPVARPGYPDSLTGIFVFLHNHKFLKFHHRPTTLKVRYMQLSSTLHTLFVFRNIPFAIFQ